MKSNPGCKILVFLLLIIVSATAPTFAEPDDLLQPGDLAPACSLEGTDGNRHDFPASGSWSMVFYWSLFCHSCLDEMPAVQSRIASISESVSPYFVSLDTKKMEQALKNFCQKRQLSKPILMEEIASDSYVTADQWGVVMTPSVFIVAPDGKIAYSHAGPMDIEKFFADFAEMQQTAKSSTCLDEKK